MDIHLKYLWKDKDRHGNVRLYVAPPSRAKIRIRERPGTPEFLAAYQAAIDGEGIDNRGTVQLARGSFGYACKAYMASGTFRALDPGTQDWQRRELEGVCLKHETKPIAAMLPEHVRKLRDEQATPNTANHRLKALRALFKWAVPALGLSVNPRLGVERVKAPSEGHHTWSEIEIALFEERHPIGSMARLAMALMLYTACRREDVIRLGPQHVRDSHLVYAQAKNEHRKPVHLAIPLRPELKLIIDATPSSHLAFLTAANGQPFKLDNFSGWFARRCAEAGIPHCTAHGLRKAAATRLAEAGCTPHEIQAITGHRTLSEVERYTKAVEQKRMAEAAMQKLTVNKNPPTASIGGRKIREKA
jgi:integrase